MVRRVLLALVVSLLVTALAGLPAAAQPAPAEELVVDVRPELPLVGQTVVVAATFTESTPPETTTPGPRAFLTVINIDFGDGSPMQRTVSREDPRNGIEVSFTNVFTRAGTFPVTVRVFNVNGFRTSRTFRVQVVEGVARLEGADRFGTAVEVSREDFPTDGSAEAVLLARADQFADALTAAQVAVDLRAPVLLTATDAVPEITLAEITRALGDDGMVYLLGGEAAISPAVADQLSALGYETVRIAGADRIETALRLAEFALSNSMVGAAPPREAVLASAADFPDALSGAALAASEQLPVLLTGPAGLDPRVAQFLSQLRPASVLLTGGPAALSPQVVADLAALGIPAERLEGPDRFATSAAVAESRFPGADAVFLATGLDFPDALSGAPAAGRRDAPVLLVGDRLPEPVRAYLADRAGQIDRVFVLGGTQAVPPEVVAEARAVLGL